MKSILLDEAYRTIKVNEGSGQITVPMAQAVIRSLAVNAVKGNQRAQRLFTELLFTTERENKRLHDEWLDVAITYKVEWERELERRERLGIEGQSPCLIPTMSSSTCAPARFRSKVLRPKRKRRPTTCSRKARSNSRPKSTNSNSC